MTARLTETLIQEGASAASFRRGRELHQNGAVIATNRDDNLLVAMVLERMPPPYTVEIAFNADGRIAETDCPCSFKGAGW